MVQSSDYLTRYISQTITTKNHGDQNNETKKMDNLTQARLAQKKYNYVSSAYMKQQIVTQAPDIGCSR